MDGKRGRGCHGAWAVGLLVALALAPSVPASAGQIRLGTSLSPPSLDAIQPYVGAQAGIFRKHGLDVQVSEFRGGTTTMKALLAGELDVGVMGLTDAIVAGSKGVRVRVFLLASQVTPYHLVAREETGPPWNPWSAGTWVSPASGRWGTTSPALCSPAAGWTRTG